MTMQIEKTAQAVEFAASEPNSSEKKLFFFQEWHDEGILKGHVVVQLALVWKTMKHVYWQGIVRKDQYSDALALAYDAGQDFKKDVLSRRFSFSPTEITGMLVYKGQLKRPERKLKVS